MTFYYSKKTTQIFLINKKFLRNEGSIINMGKNYGGEQKKLYQRLNAFIKRSEIYLPKWPVILVKLKGVMFGI